MRISSFKIIIAFVVLTIVGLALVTQLPVKLSPSQELPQINVSFSMYGSPPRVVEQEATSRLESMLSRMKGIESISSTSGNGWGHISIRLDKHTPIDAARFEASTIIRQAWSSLPEAISYPVISLNRSDDSSRRFFMTYTVNAPAVPIQIQQFAENQIRPRLSQIEGVSRVNVRGAMPMEWQVEYDYEQLKKLNISVLQIQQAIREHFGKEFLGVAPQIDTGGDQSWTRVALIPQIRYDETPDLRNIVVCKRDERLIRIADVARIEHLEAPAQGYFRINGLNSIYLSIEAGEHANQLQLAKKIRRELEDIQMNFPPGYEIHLNYDATQYIQEELNKIYFRCGLTLFILLLFVLLAYRNLKYTLLIVISLIVNIAVAVIFYYLAGVEIQLYSLAGITISLTLIIDNTIIMSDQIIKRGNRKAFIAILMATLTTIGALVIIFFLPEKIRLNLRDFAWVVIINLALSLVIALFLIPALLDKLHIIRSEKVRPVKKRKARFYIGFNRFYAAFCRVVWRWRAVVIIIMVLSFGLPVFMLPAKIEKEGYWSDVYNKTLGSEYYMKKLKPYVDVVFGGTLRLFVEKVYNDSYFADRGEETALYVTATLPNGATVAQMNELVQKMESYISQFPEVRQFQTTIESARRASINIRFTKEHQTSSFPFILESRLITRSNQLGGGSWSVYGLGDGFTNDMRENAGGHQIEMFGFNYDELLFWADSVKGRLLENKRIKGVTSSSEFSRYRDDYEEFGFDINKEKLAQQEIQPMQLFSALYSVFGQRVRVGELSTENGMEQIVLTSLQSSEYNIWDLNHTPLLLNGRYYKLDDLVHIQKEQAPQKIAKVDQQYRLCLQYEYIGAYQQGRNMLDRTVEEFQKILPLGYTIENASSYNWWSKRDNRQYLLLIIVFVIIYFNASILFNSFKQPLYVVFIIPLSYIGIFLTFYLFNLNFDQGGFAAFVLLSGLTVNANIYVINEYNNIRRAKNISRMKAYLQAWNAKIRPIFLTIVSTILGFIPFLIGAKEGFWFPLAAGTIGGLVVSFVAGFCFLPLFMGLGKTKPKG